MGKIKVEKTDVLYIALEDNDKRLQRRLNQLQAGKIGNLFFADKWTGGPAALESFLKEHPSVRLVIIDTFIKFFPSLFFSCSLTFFMYASFALKYSSSAIDMGSGSSSYIIISSFSFSASVIYSILLFLIGYRATVAPDSFFEAR